MILEAMDPNIAGQYVHLFVMSLNNVKRVPALIMQYLLSEDRSLTALLALVLGRVGMCSLQFHLAECLALSQQSSL
jgi:hypothetical protein